MTSGTKTRGRMVHAIAAHKQSKFIQKAITIVPSAYFRWKKLIDLPLAIVLLIPALPIMGLLCLLIRATSSGPGFYAQSRAGKNGKPFILWKLRSMRTDAEAKTGAVWSTPNDPRVTPVGRVIRKLHLDELPQLFNVIRGEMSLVGPRPERPEIVAVLAEAIPGYIDRLAVVPGITGLAQVNLPPDTNIDSVRRKLTLDVKYIRGAGAWQDLRLLLCTGLRVIRLPLVGLLGLRYSVPLCADGSGSLEMAGQSIASISADSNRGR